MSKNYLPILSNDHIRSFGRIKSRNLSEYKLSLIKNLLPRISIDISKTINPYSLFNDSNIKEIILEIGFGSGDYIAYMAKNNPQIGFIGTEVFVNGIASLLGKIEKDNISNIKIFNGDARLLINQLSNNCINLIFILFPDPWPKKKHHKKRLIQNEFLTFCKKIIHPENGSIEIVTDHKDYQDWIENHISNCCFLEKQQKDYYSETNFQTKYQKKAIRESRDIKIFSYKFL